jgi:hypothetical protein
VAGTAASYLASKICQAVSPETIISQNASEAVTQECIQKS